MDYINDILFQLYEFKREKARKPRRQAIMAQIEMNNKGGGWLGWVSVGVVFSTITAGVLLRLYLAK